MTFIFHFIEKGCHPEAIDFHSIIFQDGKKMHHQPAVVCCASHPWMSLIIFLKPAIVKSAVENDDLMVVKSPNFCWLPSPQKKNTPVN